MIAVELQFLANRYHGTVWGKHVNEGVAEWPPSPYRLFRAMYDAWKRKCSDLSEAEVRAVFERLATQAPTFHLPPVVAAHTRSYLNSNTEDASDKALIFDGFVTMKPDARCFLSWDVDLPGEERRNLQTLLGSLNYLGRSESWVEARLANTVETGISWKPCIEYLNDSGQNVISVACPLPAAEYKLKQPSWLHALAYSSGALLKEKLSGPPAMRYVPYSVPHNAVTTWLPARSDRLARHLSAAVLELSGKVLPGIGDTIRVAERVRGRLMRYFEHRGGSPALVHGKYPDGKPLTDHSHLFILPRANRLGRIDHVLIYTRHAEGFAADVEDSIAKVHKIRWIEEICCVASWFGRLDDREVRPMARIAKSSTPFVTVRHTRRGRDNFLEDEIRRECKNHKLPEPVRVGLSELNVMRFRRNREGEPSRPGHAVEIEFPEPVPTPFSLGYGCHFGLGQFEKM